jgi:hypothetical protein
VPDTTLNFSNEDVNVPVNVTSVAGERVSLTEANEQPFGVESISQSAAKIRCFLLEFYVVPDTAPHFELPLVPS